MAVHYAALTPSFSLLFKFSMSWGFLCTFPAAWNVLLLSYHITSSSSSVRALPKVTSLEKSSWITQPKLGPHGFFLT